jgi:hypothetical protein
VVYLERDLFSATQAQTSLLYLKEFDWGTTNSLIKLQMNGRMRLSNYIKEVEESKKEGRDLGPITLNTYQAARSYLFPFTFAEKREADFFWGKMLPLAQKFVNRNGILDIDFSTNNIGKYRIDFFQDKRPGCLADLKLKNGYSFSFLSDGTNADVWAFNDGKTKTYYALEGAPKDKIDAVKALSLRNKLSSTNALELAEKFFRLQGHKEDNFHPAELHQSYWSGGDDSRGGELPYYEVEWYRKDVKMTDLQSGIATLPYVRIEVSGIDSHLISYTKGFMPVDGDF